MDAEERFVVILDAKVLVEVNWQVSVERVVLHVVVEVVLVVV